MSKGSILTIFTRVLVWNCLSLGKSEKMKEKKLEKRKWELSESWSRVRE